MGYKSIPLYILTIEVVFVLGVIVNWKMFYTIDGVWQFKKLKSNWRYISLTVKYPTHTRKIFYTIIFPSNHFHSFENLSPHSLSSLMPSLSWRKESATASEAQIQSPTHGPAVVPTSPSAGEGSFSCTPPSSSLFRSCNPSFFLPPFHSDSILELIHSLSVSCSSRRSWRWGLAWSHSLNLFPTHAVAALNGFFF